MKNPYPAIDIEATRKDEIWEEIASALDNINTHFMSEGKRLTTQQIGEQEVDPHCDLLVINPSAATYSPLAKGLNRRELLLYLKGLLTGVIETANKKGL